MESLSKSIAAMIRGGENPATLPGIGPRIADHLRELVETGTLAALEEPGRSFPRGLLELTKIRGLGPRKAAALWEALGIGSVAELEEAIRDGRVAGVRGFGAASAAKLLEAIAETRDARARTLRARAERLLVGILSWMEDAPGLLELEVAGSLRRRAETVADVDLLARAEGDESLVVAHFAAFPGAALVEAAGSTRGTLVLRSGLQVDLRVIPTESWGSALHYFTGSKEQNVRIRQLAKRRGLKVGEYGVFREAEGGREGTRIAGATEEELFAALGMAWIPPELREGRGELEAAAAGRLPKLINLADLKGDLQMHSTWSDGRYPIEQMALACRALGYQYLAMTDHSGGALTMVQGLTAERARAQRAEIEEVQERLEGIRILRSMEVDILRDGSLDMDDDTLAELDLVVISVHSFMKMDGAAMTERVLKAIQHPEVDILGHPTGRILGRRPSFALDMDAVLEAAAELDVAVEINANPNRLDLSDVHAFRARELGVNVVVSTDAHTRRELENMQLRGGPGAPRLVRSGRRAEHPLLAGVQRLAASAGGVRTLP